MAMLMIIQMVDNMMTEDQSDNNDDDCEWQ